MSIDSGVCHVRWLRYLKTVLGVEATLTKRLFIMNHSPRGDDSVDDSRLISWHTAAPESPDQIIGATVSRGPRCVAEQFLILTHATNEHVIPRNPALLLTVLQVLLDHVLSQLFLSVPALRKMGVDVLDSFERRGGWNVTVLIFSSGRCVVLIFQYPQITYYWTVHLILDHSYLAGNLTNSKIDETKALEPIKSWHFCISNFRTC
jgi:hypothetical protein